jgi:hypothetical protein
MVNGRKTGKRTGNKNRNEGGNENGGGKGNGGGNGGGNGKCFQPEQRRVPPTSLLYIPTYVLNHSYSLLYLFRHFN